MKPEHLQQSALAARTTGLSAPKMLLLTGATDPADPATWTEAPDVDLTDRPTLAFAAAGVVNDDAGNKAYVDWPLADMETTLATGATIVRLGIAEGTGALATASRGISDTAFSVVVAGGGKLRTPASTQRSSEQ